jgi:hypothetical protein
VHNLEDRTNQNAAVVAAAAAAATAPVDPRRFLLRPAAGARDAVVTLKESR